MILFDDMVGDFLPFASLDCIIQSEPYDTDL
jgi:hypothetical protein